ARRQLDVRQHEVGCGPQRRRAAAAAATTAGRQRDEGQGLQQGAAQHRRKDSRAPRPRCTAPAARVYPGSMRADLAAYLALCSLGVAPCGTAAAQQPTEPRPVNRLADETSP